MLAAAVHRAGNVAGRVVAEQIGEPHRIHLAGQVPADVVSEPAGCPVRVGERGHVVAGVVGEGISVPERIHRAHQPRSRIILVTGANPQHVLGRCQIAGQVIIEPLG